MAYQELNFAANSVLTSALMNQLQTNITWLLNNKAGLYLPVNGNFDIWQQGTSFNGGTVNDNDTYNADQCILLSEDTTDGVGVDQDTDVPVGSRYSLKATVVTAAKKFGFLFPMEAQHSEALDGMALSVAFQAKSAQLANLRVGIVEFASGTFSADAITSDIISAWNAAGSNPTLIAGCSFVNTPANLALGSAYAELSVADISMSASSVSNRAIFIWVDDTDASAADVLNIAQVRLIIGSEVPTFIPPDSVGELLRCQRYYRRHSGTWGGWANSTTEFHFSLTFNPPMAKTPSIVFIGSGSAHRPGVETKATSTPVSDGGGTNTNGAHVNVTTAAVSANPAPGYIDADQVEFDARL